MRSLIYWIKTKAGSEFRMNERATIGGESVTVRFIEQVNLVADDDQETYGFYDVYGVADEKHHLSQNGAGVRRRIAYSDVSEVDDMVPLIDLKVRHAAFEKTTTEEFRERATDLPREALRAQIAELNTALEALGEEEEEPGNREGSNGNQASGAAPGENKQPESVTE